MSSSKNKVLQVFEFFILFVTAGVSLAISVLDMLGLFDANAWIYEKIPSLTLLCVGFVASYLIFERKGKLEEISQSTAMQSKQIIQAVTKLAENVSKENFDVSVYSHRAEFFTAFAKKVKFAKQVDDLVWDNQPTEPLSQKDTLAMSDYASIVSEVRHKPDVVWRELAVYNTKRFKRSLSGITDKEMVGFNAACFEPPPPDSIPRLSFMVIDNTDLFLFHVPGGENLRLHITHPDIVKYFSAYYEALWKSAIKVKQGGAINNEVVERLKQLYLGV